MKLASDSHLNFDLQEFASSKLYFCIQFAFAGGTGVPPGTRPETCKRCKGSGMVSTL